MNRNVLQILIVDDEAAGRGILKKLIPELLAVPFKISEANNADDALEIIAAQAIDLLFLDIQMPGKNGFDLLKEIPLISFETIFVTGYDKYAVAAFRFNALDYLLKPVDVDELKNALEKAVDRIRNKKKEENNVGLLLASIGGNALDKKVAVHNKDKVIFISLKRNQSH